MRHSTKSYPENVTDPSPPHRNQSRVQQHQPTTHRPDALTLRHLTILSHGQLKGKKGINTHTLLQILTLSFLKEWCAESCRIPDLNSFHLFSCDLTATTYRRKIWIKHMRNCLFMGLWLSSHSPTHIMILVIWGLFYISKSARCNVPSVRPITAQQMMVHWCRLILLNSDDLSNLITTVMFSTCFSCLSVDGVIKRSRCWSIFWHNLQSLSAFLNLEKIFI